MVIQAAPRAGAGHAAKAAAIDVRRLLSNFGGIYML
jgi:hypothetical protein